MLLRDLRNIAEEGHGIDFLQRNLHCPKPKQRPKQRRRRQLPNKISQKQKRKAKKRSEDDATGWDDASEVDIGGVSNVKEENRVWNNLTDLYRISLGAHSK